MQTDLSKTNSPTPPRPMLAKRYAAFPKGTKVWSQPKLDGARALVTAAGIFSRSGIRIQSCNHIERALANLFAEHPQLVLDGELFSPELRDDLGAIIGLVNRRPRQRNDHSVALSFYVFDIADEKLKFSKRLARCNELEAAFEGSSAIRFVPTVEVTDETKLDALYESYLHSFEGQVIRTDEVYIGTRSSRLQKRKPFMDAEFSLVGLEPIGSKQRPGLRALLKTDDGLEFAALVRGNIDASVRGLSSRAQAVARYSGRSRAGIPRCATVVAVYPDGRRF